jgi:drug/metabolite transporter (DMT)-like permease
MIIAAASTFQFRIHTSGRNARLQPLTYRIGFAAVKAFLPGQFGSPKIPRANSEKAGFARDFRHAVGRAKKTKHTPQYRWERRAPTCQRIRESEFLPMNVATGISLKVISVVLFAMMSTLIRAAGQKFPLGEVVFFRSFFALIPVVAYYAWRGELYSVVATRRPLGHLGRGTQGICAMFVNFAALARLPLMDATAISFASPLMTVALAAIVLKERVRRYRWSAVALGFGGVIVMMWPYLDIWGTFAVSSTERTIGAICAITGAVLNAGTVIQTRRLTMSETTSAIVFYFSLICSIAGLATLPLGWLAMSPLEAVMLVMIGIIGGMSHLLLTECYRHAPASVVAPFDYTAMIWAFLFGYFVFGELPSVYVYVGAVIVVACGLFVLWRERQLGAAEIKASAMEGSPVAAPIKTP